MMKSDFLLCSRFFGSYYINIHQKCQTARLCNRSFKTLLLSVYFPSGHCSLPEFLFRSYIKYIRITCIWAFSIWRILFRIIIWGLWQITIKIQNYNNTHMQNWLIGTMTRKSDFIVWLVDNSSTLFYNFDLKIAKK